MRLLYATSIDLPSTRANRLQITSMAKEFHRLLGDNFVLGLREKKEQYALTVPYTELGKHTRSYALAWKYLRLAKEGGFSHVYCREERLLFFMMFFNQVFFRLPLQFCYEIHHLVSLHAWWHCYVMNHAARLISITRAMKDALVSLGYPEQSILVAPDAVDIAMFDTVVSKSEARGKLALPRDKYIIVYTGTIDELWKGVDVLYQSAKRLGEDYLCVIVGGKPHYVVDFNTRHTPIPNFLLIGYRPHDEIPLYLKAADVLVLPNSAQAEISRIGTSPMKLFEYMAASRPIVGSDLPSLREILHEQNAFLVPPDDADALAQGIQAIVTDPQRGTALAAQARRDASAHTWGNRARRILTFLREPRFSSL